MENVKINDNDGCCEIIFEGDLTIMQSNSIKTLLQEQLQNSEKISLNLTNVSSVDLTGLQLIIAANQSAKQENKQLSLQPNRAESFNNALKNSALQKYFAENICYEEA